MNHKMLPFLVRHSAWQITHCQVKSDGKIPYERLRGRQYGGRVAEFAEVVHIRDPPEGCRYAEVGRRMGPGLVVGKEPGIGWALRWHFGRSSQVSVIWRRPENQRWDRKMLTEMIGDPWNPTPQPKDKPPQVRGVHITLERQIKCGGTKGCSACFGQAKVHSPERQRLWTMKLYRQQPRAQLTPMSRPQDRQRVAPRPVQAAAQHWLRVDPRRRTSTWKWLQTARQHSRRALRSGRWRLRTMQAQNVRR